MTIPESIQSDDNLRYPSLESLRAAHTELLKAFRKEGNTAEIIANIELFIQRGKATGVLLDADDDRWTAQTQLDYWATQLYHPGYEPPDATLDEFDPQLAPELDDSLCPYMGLDAFLEGNESVFFGRERLVNELIDKLKTTRFLPVLGSSGSGKSSLVRAGLLPELKKGALPGSADWLYFKPMVPGANPLLNLARLVKPPDGDTTQLDYDANAFREYPEYLAQIVSEETSKNIVLVIDQFEEIFTLCTDEVARQRFVENLLALCQAPEAEHRVIITMRTDFEMNITRLPKLQALFEQDAMRVTPLTASELRQSIEAPAALIGLKFEQGVVDALLNDILGEPSALPLLQFTLLKLWEKRERNRVTWETYRKLGGGRQALARSADEFYNQLMHEEQVTMRRILLKMVRPGEGLEITSNRIERKVLYQKAEARDRIDRVLEKLIQERLVRISEGNSASNERVEIAHEALVRNWPRLVEWLEEERVALRQRQRLTTAAEEWQRLNGATAALWRRELLEEALRYDDLNELERKFVRASKARQQRSRRFWGYGIAAIITVLTFATVINIQSANRAESASTQAFNNLKIAETEKARAIEQQQIAEAASIQANEQKAKAEEQARIARSGELAATARNYLDDRLDLSLLLSIEGAKYNTYASRNMLLTSLQSNPRLVTYLQNPKGITQSDIFNPNSKLIASRNCISSNDFGICNQSEIQLWDVTDPSNPKRIGKPLTANKSDVWGIAFSSDNKELASSGCAELDDSGSCLHSEVLLWDISDPAAPHKLGKPFPANNAETRTLVFSSDGRTLASGACTGRDNSENCTQGEIALWDINDPTIPRKIGELNITNQIDMTALAFNPDDRLLAAGGCGNYENDTDSSRKCTQGGIVLWDISNPTVPTKISEPLTGHTDSILSIAFSPDGQFLVSGSADRNLILWDLYEPGTSEILTGHTAVVQSVTFSPDGKSIISRSRNEIIKWSIAEQNTPLQIGKPLIGKNNDIEIVSVAFSPDHKILASGSCKEREESSYTCVRGDVSLWDVSNPAAPIQIEEPLSENHSSVWGLDISPDGKILVSGSCAEFNESYSCIKGEVLLWDISDPAAPTQIGGPLTGNTSSVWSVAFSPDGKTVASGGCAIQSESDYFCMQGEVLLWDVSNPAAPLQLGEPFAIDSNEVEYITFSPDGKTLAAGVCAFLDDSNFCGGGEVLLWNVSNPTEPLQIGKPLAGHTDYVWSVAFSPNGQMLASGGADTKIILWDISNIDTPSQIGEPLTGHTDYVWSVRFSPDGQTLTSGGEDNTVILWDVSNPTNPIKLTSLIGHEDSITSSAIQSDGKILASGSRDASIILWDLDPQSWAEKACQRAGRNLSRAEWNQYFPGEEYLKTCQQWPSLDSEPTPTATP